MTMWWFFIIYICISYQLFKWCTKTNVQEIRDILNGPPLIVQAVGLFIIILILPPILLYAILYTALEKVI